VGTMVDRDGMSTPEYPHPHPDPPLEGEGELRYVAEKLF
jgi:hypothetical protein